jgi:hypothetical protein
MEQDGKRREKRTVGERERTDLSFLVEAEEAELQGCEVRVDEQREDLVRGAEVGGIIVLGMGRNGVCHRLEDGVDVEVVLRHCVCMLLGGLCDGDFLGNSKKVG